MSQIEYVVRVYGKPNNYGLGEVISPGVALFRAGTYDLTKDELQKVIADTGKRKMQINEGN